MPHSYNDMLDAEEIEALREVSAQPQRRPVVLLVDDDPLVLAEMRQLIEGADLDCLTAGSGAQALRCIGRDESAIDLLITDLRMEEQSSGLELIRQLNVQGTFLPIIVVSGNPEVREVIEALRLNVLDFLIKPVDPAYFLKILGRYL